MITPESRPLFPSAEWFDFLCADAKEHPGTYEALGFADFRLLFEIECDDGIVDRFGIVFDGYDVLSAGKIEDVLAFNAEAAITGPRAVWSDMVGNIVDNQSADSSHTLNALSIAEAPLRVYSDDPLGKDKFFRYAETLQTLFDSTSRPILIGV